MKDIKNTVSALLCASLLLGLCSCSDKPEETTTERATTTTTTEETTSEETTTEETTLGTVSDETLPPAPLYANEDEAYQVFIEGLTVAIRNGEGYYYGPTSGDDIIGENGIAAYYLAWGDSFYYTYTDMDGDGIHELVIGHEDYAESGETLIIVDGFVVADKEGGFDILLISWERSQTQYLGDGYFLTSGSGGAGLHIWQISHYDGNDIVSDAILYEEYVGGGDAPSDEPEYTLYLGDGMDEDNALYGQEATDSWAEMLEEAKSHDNELAGTEWSEVII